ncbi:DUF2914 domain-containing protein [Allohahella marinimesophila]|uniref:DUF2914 domain-containing protein n=1 Tax=Allohahella marinimesophila TaxID=1054972 RepID=A0ABP7NK77_9GAMM
MSQKNGFSAHRKDRISAPSTVTVYYWHRIVLFGLLLIFIIGGLAFWAFSQFDTAPKAVIPGSSAELAAERNESNGRTDDALSDYEQSAMTPTPADAPVFASQVEDAPVADAPGSVEPDSALEPTLDESSTGIGDESEADVGDSATSGSEAPKETVAEPDTVIVDDAPVIDEAPGTEEASGNDSADVDGMQDEVADTNTDADPAVAQGVDSERGKPTTTEILSEAIARASLARGLREREPIGIYKNAVSLNGQDLITVFMFTQTRGYVGEELFHNWYLNDDRIAQVVIKPWVSPMRASSSKKIIPTMIGDWRVEIVDATGKKLAVTTFEVVE